MNLILAIRNILNSSPILAAAGDRPPTMLIIIFWILLIIWALGGFFWRENPKWSAGGSNVLLIVLFAILGLYTFGFQ